MARSVVHRHLAAAFSCLALAVAACGSTTSQPSGPAVVTPTPVTPTSVASPPPATEGATPSATAHPLPAGSKPWPTAFAAEMPAGRYFAAPPFVLPISLEIAEAGWHAGHTNPIFVDIQRYDAVDVGGLPTRLVGLAIPEDIRGPDGAVPQAGLTPTHALDLIAGRSSVASSNRAAVRLLGLDGERLDLQSDTSNNAIFGAGDGTFGLEPSLDLRLSVLPFDEGLLLVLVMAPPGDLEAAWTAVTPILESARFEP